MDELEIQDVSLPPQRSDLPAALQDGVRHLDVNRTSLEMLFFIIFDATFSSSDDLIRAVDRMELDLETLEAATDLHQCYAGWLYWLLYVKGYCQYAASGEIGHGNIYYDYLLRHPDIDPGITDQLRDAVKAQTYVARQYRDMDLCRHAGGNVPAVDPLLVFTGPGEPEQQDRVFEIGRPAPIFARRIDGWHRLFAAKLFGIARLPCEFVAEEDVEDLIILRRP